MALTFNRQSFLLDGRDMKITGHDGCMPIVFRIDRSALRATLPINAKVSARVLMDHWRHAIELTCRVAYGRDQEERARLPKVFAGILAQAPLREGASLH